MKSLTLTKKQQLLFIAARVSKKSKRNPQERVLRFIAAVEQKETV
jgi:hypothetical protein